jgi:hypothetical protein
MGFRMTVKSDNRAQVKAAAGKAAAGSVEDAANELLRAANESVPYREGVLEGSGEVSVDASGKKAQVSYGGEASAYAVRQHEDTTLSHPGKGRAKWLEYAAKENAARLGMSIATGVRERLG